tara:strand:- start:1860 stop:1994 length:135 start_codon:yes stop_codon:yes gene_type:complete
MNAIYAGILAWFIELSVAGTMFLILKREESKVYKRRDAKKKEKH